MRQLTNKQFYRLAQEYYDKKNHDVFHALNSGFRYSEDQKMYAFELIQRRGVRSTAKLLEVPRRTLQRWCRKYSIYVPACPSWVKPWAERRRKRREFWKRRGY